MAELRKALETRNISMVADGDEDIANALRFIADELEQSGGELVSIAIGQFELEGSGDPGDDVHVAPDRPRRVNIHIEALIQQQIER